MRDASELHDLPLEALGMPAEMRELLWRWGIRKLGAFVALGGEPLTERLGPAVLPFFVRATGGSERPLRCVAPVESYAEAVEFEHEIETLEPLLFLLRRLLEQIAWRLEATYLVAATLTLRLGLAQGGEYLRTFKIPAPTARVEVLFRALHTHLERYTAEQPIVSLHLEARPCRPARQQFGLFESALRDPNQFFETLTRLIALLGNDRVGVPAPEDSHRPDAFRVAEVDLEDARPSCFLFLFLPLPAPLPPPAPRRSRAQPRPPARRSSERRPARPRHRRHRPRATLRRLVGRAPLEARRMGAGAGRRHPLPSLSGAEEMVPGGGV